MKTSILAGSTGRTRLVAAAALLVCVIIGGAFWWRAAADKALVAVVQRGDLTAYITATGVLRPTESMTYRSPIVGRETEILELAPEGTRVKAGDLVARLDTSELSRDVERVQQELRQLQIDVQVAEGEWQEAKAAVQAVTEGEGVLTVEEARTRLQLAEKKVDRLRQDFERLKPLMEKGFMTRDELARTAGELELAEEELALARKRTAVVVQLTHPRETQRAALQLTQKRSRLENMRARLQETQFRLNAVVNLIARCTLFAQRPGMVVYEEFLAVSPRRKIRVGDRVTGSQGLVTIPEISRMRVETTVSEAEVHRVRPGQAAAVRLEAFPDLQLAGRVARVGTLASSSIERPLDEKRFDLVIDLDSSTADLRPEMTARADVAVANRQGVLLVPVNAVVNDRGAFVAHVVGRTGLETRQVELGESNDRFVEVLAGLAEHERVALADGGAVPDPAATARPQPTRFNALAPR